MNFCIYFNAQVGSTYALLLYELMILQLQRQVFITIKKKKLMTLSAMLALALVFFFNVFIKSVLIFLKKSLCVTVSFEHLRDPD